MNCVPRHYEPVRKNMIWVYESHYHLPVIPDSDIPCAYAVFEDKVKGSSKRLIDQG